VKEPTRNDDLVVRYLVDLQAPANGTSCERFQRRRANRDTAIVPNTARIPAHHAKESTTQ
jgi:hypothetical protein